MWSIIRPDIIESCRGEKVMDPPTQIDMKLTQVLDTGLQQANREMRSGNVNYKENLSL